MEMVRRAALMIGNKYLMSKGAIWPSSAQFRVTPTRKLQKETETTRRLYPNLWASEELQHLTDGQEKESPTQVPEKEHPGNREGIIMSYCHGNQGKTMLH